MIKAFIFDLDGTLVDSIQDLTNAVNYSLENLNLPTLSESEVQKRLGNGIDQLMIDSLPEAQRHNKKLIANSLELMATHYGQNWKKNTKLYPEVDSILDQIMIKNIPMAIISNKPQAFLEEIVSFLMPKWEFSAIIGGRGKYPLKPNPQSTLDIVKSWGLKVEEVAFVGDGDADVKTALAAGTQLLAATWGFRSIEELKALGATIFIDSPSQISQYL